MKLSKFLSCAFSITLFSLLYVWQQTEIVRLAYAGQKQQALFQELLDKNSILRYNIEKSCSLVQLGSVISGKQEFQMPEKYQVVRLGPRGVQQTGKAKTQETLFSRIFSVKRQAEAKTLNP